MKILLCGDTFPYARVILQPKVPMDELIARPQAEARTALAGVDVIIPLMSRIDAAFMDAGRFRLIQQWGVGLEGVDLEAARARGIMVANVPSAGTGNAESVAEHIVLLMLALLRQLPSAQADVRASLLGTPLGRSLMARTVCIFGLGTIGRQLALRLRGFGVRLIGISREPDAARAAEFGLAACYSIEDRNQAFAQTDVLALCTPLTETTRGIIDAEALAALPAAAIVVNTARGGLVDYAALYAALKSGRLAGAGLDVFWQEPIAPDDPLLSLPNVIATPHVAGVTDVSYEGIASGIAENVDRLRRGEPILNRAV